MKPLVPRPVVLFPLLLALAMGASEARAGNAPGNALAKEGPARFAVVLGYNGGAPDPRAPLAFADDDAARFYLQVLPSAERAFLLTTFDKTSARLFGELTESAQPPTRRELSRVLGEVAWLIREAKARGQSTELVFYFAGHGDVSDGGEGFVVLADGPFTRDELSAQVVEASPADVNHVLLDACASYFMVARGDESGRVKLSPALLDVLKGERRGQDASAWSRTGTLVSTSSAAEVHESMELGGGVFSYLLRSALSGAADTNADGRVEYAEAAAFISSASGSLKDPRARLAVHAEAPAQRPHVALMDLARSGAEHFLLVDAGRPVHLRLLDATGVPYAELHPGEGRALISLVGNPYYVVQRGDEEALLVPRAAGAYALSSLRFQKAPRARGSDGPFALLFADVFDATYLRGFLSTSTSSLVPPAPGPAFPVAYAAGGEPPFELPYLELGVSAFAGAGALAVAAAGFAGMSLWGFATLEEGFSKTGTLDPEIAFQVETWRAAANTATVGALVLGLTGAALVGGELFSEEAP